MPRSTVFTGARERRPLKGRPASMDAAPFETGEFCGESTILECIRNAAATLSVNFA
jgi:hypothetical protein